MTDDRLMEKIYLEKLEESIISYIASEYDMSFEKAMNLYYRSKLADRIADGEFGIQYLDYKVLVAMLVETEPELFRK